MVLCSQRWSPESRRCEQTAVFVCVSQPAEKSLEHKHSKKGFCLLLHLSLLLWEQHSGVTLGSLWATFVLTCCTVFGVQAFLLAPSTPSQASETPACGVGVIHMCAHAGEVHAHVCTSFWRVQVRLPSISVLDSHQCVPSATRSASAHTRKTNQATQAEQEVHIAEAGHLVLGSGNLHQGVVKSTF